MQIKNKVLLYTILTNLLAGNTILILAGLASSTGEINYWLMLGLSAACILVYAAVFKYVNLQKFSTLKLGITSVLCCMLIITLGNSIALLLKDPADFAGNLGPVLFMAIAGNIILFPLSVGIGLLNLYWFNKVKHLG
ncbi:hypothetical protein [Pedobacter caeni]|uniref:4 TMS phage holin, superfamily IV n=1 Tax=Pedobacter caeni TaxID=288992 RepID=A0A1M4V517_9SPHI|nr:hypothetical protein [Pedobacter caeni]SHE64074.1 hypothetical protein SAMN04488522_101781 [Pedobacter caeni]